MTTYDNSGIVFDAKSGISEEEQREILAKINNITEKNRLSLSESGQAESKSPQFKARKSGGVFPVIVIIIAFAALAGGISALSSMQWKTDAQARTGAKVYNSVERALIEEIRKETHNEAAANAGGELERLNRDYYQAEAIEDQMSAFFANLNRQITDNNLDEAGGTIKAMRDFINTPAFAALRSIQARKGLYVQLINAFETMIEETKQYKAVLNSDNPGHVNPQPDLQATIARLEQNIAEKDKTIDALSSQGSGASRRLNELEKANTTLQTENQRLGRTNNTLQADNKRLTTDLEKQTQLASSLQQNVNQITPRLQQAETDLQTEKARTATLTQTVNSREATIANRNDVIARIRSEVEIDKDFDQMSIADIKASIVRIQSALRSLQ